MPDFDLARIYGYDTSTFNQRVKRFDHYWIATLATKQSRHKQPR